jgi:hypothetical protein
MMKRRELEKGKRRYPTKVIKFKSVPNTTAQSTGNFIHNQSEEGEEEEIWDQRLSVSLFR